MTTKPCGWLSDGCADLLGVSSNPALAQQWIDFSIDALWRATGQRYGACPITVRPCRADCGDSYWGGLPYPARLDGQWINIECGCVSKCGCGGFVSEVALEGPVASIDTIWLDGTVITGSAVSSMVRVDDYRQVVRVDGQRWPRCQNLGAPLTETGTWAIKYLKGHLIPAGGPAAANALAAEFIKACDGDSSCRLPQRIQTITRQGVTVGFQDTFTYLSKGRFGLYEVDAWIASVNTRGKSPARFASPDRPRPRVQTWPA